MTVTNFDKELSCLARVAAREEARAHTEFAERNGRPYDGASDADWDDLDKDYAGIEGVMDIIREIATRPTRGAN